MRQPIPGALSITDGEWLSDRRDPWPIRLRPWQSEPDSEHWRWEVRRGDFEDLLDLRGGLSDRLPVWGEWDFSEGWRAETVIVASAMVKPARAEDLLRRLQMDGEPQGRYLPSEGDRLDWLSGYGVRAWVETPYSEDGLDRFDPYAGQLPYPPPRPGSGIRRLFGLQPDIGYRIWRTTG